MKRLWVNGRNTRYSVQGAGRSDAPCAVRAVVRAWRADGRGADGRRRRVAARGVEASRHPAAGRAGDRPPAGAAGALQRSARRARAACRLDGADDGLLAGALRRSRRSAGKDGSMTETAAETRTVIVEIGRGACRGGGGQYV